MVRRIALWVIVGSFVACGGRAIESSHEAPVAVAGQGGSAASSPPEASGGTGEASGGASEASGGAVACPRSNIVSAPCPAQFPSQGSCCPVLDQVCIYPDFAAGLRAYAQCSGYPDIGQSWTFGSLNDTRQCMPLEVTFPLGNGAPACQSRQTASCTSCNCAPSDMACAARCPAITTDVITPQDELDRQVRATADACGQVPRELTVEVTFESGCPTTLMARVRGNVADYQPFFDCMQQSLNVMHFECADGLSCAMFTRSTLR